MSALDENPNCEATHATFRLSGDSLDPREVEEALGLRGDFGAAKGEIRRAGRAVHRTVRQPTGVWYLTTDGRLGGTSVERHLLYLLERIEPVGEKLAQLIQSSSLTADFYCYWVSATGQGGPVVSSETLGRIAVLSAELSFEFHALGTAKSSSTHLRECSRMTPEQAEV
jgi:hypothetical protein